MSNTPEPDRTPQGPAYQGRLLARPDDEVVDQGAGFDLGTLVSRRRIFGLLGLGAGAVALAACSDTATGSSSTSASTSSSTSEGEIPEETNGPYPADGTADLNVLEDSGIVRSDIRTSLGSSNQVDGVPLELTMTLADLAEGGSLAGAAVYVWHCDAQGRYSMYTEGVEDETFLRGIQVADQDGTVTFTSVVPGCYSGRWTHVHFEVYPDRDAATDVANVIATSQIAFPPAMLADVYALPSYSGSSENLAGVGTQVPDDSLFGEGDWSLQVPTISGNVKSGYSATLDVGVDTTTEPSAGGMGGGPGGDTGGMPPGGGEPPSGPPPS